MRKFVGLIAVCLTLGGQTNHCLAQVRVRAVTLEGDPIPGVDVRFKDSNPKGDLYPSEENLTNWNGVAEVPVQPKGETGLAEIRINMNGETHREIDFIGRVKKVEWSNKDQFVDGFAVPLWQPGDVKSLADVVVRNPSHIVVAIRLGDNYGTESRVIAEFDQDVDWWLANILPDLPTVVDPPLARALFAQTEPGEIIPPHFDSAMRNVFAEVQRQREAARVCRMFPQGVPPQQPPPQQPPPAADHRRSSHHQSSHPNVCRSTCPCPRRSLCPCPRRSLCPCPRHPQSCCRVHQFSLLNIRRQNTHAFLIFFTNSRTPHDDRRCR